VLDEQPHLHRVVDHDRGAGAIDHQPTVTRSGRGVPYTRPPLSPVEWHSS
jgi:hypothetical protein